MKTDGDAFNRNRPLRGGRALRIRGAVAIIVLAAFCWAPSSARAISLESGGTPQPQQLGILTPEEFPLVAKGVRWLYDGYYDKAAKEFDLLRSLIPESPAGELGRVLPDAVRLREDPDNRKVQESLEKGLAVVEKKARTLLKTNSEDIRGLFYIGAAHFLRSQALRHRRSHWNALQELRAARKYLARVVERRPDAWEAYVGLGGYNYFMDALPAFANFVRWILLLPGGSRERGLQQLELGRDHSVLLGPLAQNMLLAVYSAYENKPQQAEAMALSLHQKFPNNPWFHLNLGYTYLSGPRRTKKAVGTFQEVLERARSGHPNFIREITDRARLGLVFAYSRLGNESQVRKIAGELLARPSVRPKYVTPMTDLILGQQMAKDGDPQGARVRFARVMKVKDWGHFDWRARLLGFDSGEEVRQRANSLLKDLANNSH
ncbi:MAG: hypothetical protein ACE5JS_03715 [Nitrospinota bacterium]